MTTKKTPAKKNPVQLKQVDTPVQKRLVHLEVTLADLLGRVTNIEGVLEAQQEALESLDGDLDNMINSLEDITTRVCDLECNVMDINTDLDANQKFPGQSDEPVFSVDGRVIRSLGNPRTPSCACGSVDCPCDDDDDDTLARAKCCEDKNDECPCGLVGCKLPADFDELDDDLPEVEDLGDEISMQLNHLTETCFEDADDNGWWDAYDNKGNAERLGEKLLMIHSEVTEAVECLRDCEDADVLIETDACDHISGKPVGFAIELADILIRTLDICGYLGIDIEKAVKTKLEYNRTRGYRHGNKNL